MSKPIVPQSNHSASTLPQSERAKPDSRKVAVGYVRVSTSMQAEDGLSLDAQRAAITAYCTTHNLRLSRIYEDVESGAKCDRKGLRDALASNADVFVVLKFDRLSRSIKHFIELYETYFSRSVELVAIREALRLDSALGRALVNILLVFAQMEREATGERTKEAIGHIKRSGYHFGKVSTNQRADRQPKLRHDRRSSGRLENRRAIVKALDRPGPTRPSRQRRARPVAGGRPAQPAPPRSTGHWRSNLPGPAPRASIVPRCSMT